MSGVALLGHWDCFIQRGYTRRNGMHNFTQRETPPGSQARNSLRVDFFGEKWSNGSAVFQLLTRACVFLKFPYVHPRRSTKFMKQYLAWLCLSLPCTVYFILFFSKRWSQPSSMDFAQFHSFKNTDVDGPSSKPTTSALLVGPAELSARLISAYWMDLSDRKKYPKTSWVSQPKRHFYAQFVLFPTLKRYSLATGLDVSMQNSV